MPPRQPAAVAVECRQRHPQSLGKDQRLGGKGIVQLQHLQRCGLQAMPLQKLQRRALGRQHGGFRGRAHTHRPQPVRTRLQLPALAGRRTGQQQQGGPIGFGRNGHGAQAAILASGTAPRAHHGHARGPRRGQGAGVGIAQQCGHRHHVIPRRRGQRPGVAGHRPGLLRRAGQRLRTGNGRCGIEHVPVAPRRGKGGALVGFCHFCGMAWAVLANGGAAPGLGPTGNDDVGLPQRQQGAGVGDGIQPGAALAIERPGRHPVGQPGTQGGQAGRVAIGPQGIAQNERIDRLGRHPRTLQQVGDERGGQIRHRASGQRPAHRGHRGARPAKDGPGRG